MDVIDNADNPNASNRREETSPAVPATDYLACQDDSLVRLAEVAGKVAHASKDVRR
jgi:hypothetical protein